MTKLTVEETNLLSIYTFMDGEMRGFAARTLAKVERMGEAEFAELPIYAADEA